MKIADEARAAVRDVLDARTPVWLKPPILQPAAIYLELSGEEIRRRAFLVDDPGHGELCLRPDLTVPAVREAFAQAKPPPLVAYEGLVFRRQPPGSERESEFVQIGAEWLGDGAMAPQAEAEIIALALEACRAAGTEPALKLGDVALLSAFVEALGLAEPWPQRLARALSRTGGLAGLRAHAADEAGGLAEALAALPEDHAEPALRDLMAFAGITPIGGRPLAEIAVRLRQRGALAAAPAPTQTQFDALDVLTKIDSADGLEQAEKLAETKPFAKNGAAREALARARGRLEALKTLTQLPEQTRFAPGLGRTIAYYDGFVFELEASTLGARASLGGGGRYDGLARALWPQGKRAPKALRAAGFALRPQRLAEAAR